MAAPPRAAAARETDEAEEAENVKSEATWQAGGGGLGSLPEDARPASGGGAAREPWRRRWWRFAPLGEERASICWTRGTRFPSSRKEAGSSLSFTQDSLSLFSERGDALAASASAGARRKKGRGGAQVRSDDAWERNWGTTALVGGGTGGLKRRAQVAAKVRHRASSRHWCLSLVETGVWAL